MTQALAQLDATISEVFGTQMPPGNLRLVGAVQRLIAGVSTIGDEAVRVRTTRKRLASLLAADDPVLMIVGEVDAPNEQETARLRLTLGQLLIGAVAERVFEKHWTEVVPSAYGLADDRAARGDTDFLVYNDDDQQVFRLNIKFYGAQFRRSLELVGLEPDDCFALATYKIWAATEKQNSEGLPYIFVIVGVPGMSGVDMGRHVPDRLIHLQHTVNASSRLTGKRQVEDAIVSSLVDSAAIDDQAEGIRDAFRAITEAEWRVISARKADKLLRTLLFDRAYALRVRGFARNYGGAELDMHFSVSGDLTPLDEMLSLLRERGLTALVTALERGSV